MEASKDILFLADYRGSKRRWKVVRRYGGGWLCSLEDDAAVTAEFTDASVKFGRARLLVES